MLNPNSPCPICKHSKVEALETLSMLICPSCGTGFMIGRNAEFNAVLAIDEELGLVEAKRYLKLAEVYQS